VDELPKMVRDLRVVKNQLHNALALEKMIEHLNETYSSGKKWLRAMQSRKSSE
jgi:hypothetical protein